MNSTNKETNEVIADKVVEFLEKRITLNQEIIQTKVTNSNLKENARLVQAISYDEFINEYNIFEQKIYSSNGLQKEEYEKELLKFMSEKQGLVILTNEQISEIMHFTRKAISIYGIDKGKRIHGETKLLQKVLKPLDENMSLEFGLFKNSNNEYKKLKMWNKFFLLSDTIGFDHVKTSMFYYNDIDEAFCIEGANNELFCKIDKEGVNILFSKYYENVIAGNNVYMSYVNDYNNDYSFIENSIIVLKDEFKGRQTYKTVVFRDEFNYHIDNNVANSTNIIEEPRNLNELLHNNNCDFLISDMYTPTMAHNALKTFNTYINMDELVRQKIEKTIQVIVDYYIWGIIEHPENIMCEIGKLDDKNAPINRFIINLQGELRKKLINNLEGFIFIADESYSMSLSDIALKSGLDVNIPYSFMKISLDEVWLADGKNREIIYSDNELFNSNENAPQKRLK